MTDTPTVHQALQAVTQAITHVAKNQKNQQQKFHYRGIDDVLNAIHQPLADNGVAFIPTNVDILSSTERTTKSGSIQFYVRALVHYRIIGPAGDSIDAAVIAEAADMGDKVSSKLMSMAYKYLAFQVLSIPVAGMDDADRDTPEPIHHSNAPTINELHSTLTDFANAMDTTVEQLTEKWRSNNGDITLDQFMKLPAERIAPLVRQIAAYYEKNRSK